MKRVSTVLAIALLSFAPLFGAEPALRADVPVKITSVDGLELAATWCPPQSGKGVIVMLHGLDSAREEWDNFSRVARADGWGTLAYDARGHGQSVTRFAKGFRSFGPAGPGTPWARMPDDLDAAVRFVNGEGVRTSSVCVIGASLGANVAVEYAARGGSMRALVLMSPGLNYAEFRPDNDFASIKAPRLIIVSPADRYAHASSLKLAELSPGTDLWTDVIPGHGVQMFDPNGVLAKRLLKWLDTSQR